MTSNKISFPDLVSSVAQAAGTSTRVSEVFLKELFATVSQALIDGDSVTIKGLGKFTPDGNTIDFTPDSSLANVINAPFAMFEPIPLGDVDDSLIDQLNEVPENSENFEPTPPPFNPPVDDDIDEPINITEPAKPAEPEPKPTEPAEPEPEPVEPEPEPVEPEPEPVEPEPEPVEYEHEHEPKRPSFLLGMLAGAAAMAVIALIAWTFLHTSASTDDGTDKQSTSVIAAADTTAAVTSQPVVVTDTTSSKRYLTTIATRHYGRQEFWIYIYQENKDIISDPNNIPPGTVVVVPPREKYGIDPNDKESVKKAKDETFKLLTAK